MENTAAGDIASIFQTGRGASAGDETVTARAVPMAGRTIALVPYRIAQALVLFVLATMPLLFGAVQAWVWSVYTVAMYAAFVLMLGAGRGAACLPAANGWWAAVGVFLAATLLACVPLPPGCWPG